jgi:hypothetical protein
MNREQLAVHNVVATYPSMERARDVIGALELHGIEGGDISLLGPAAEAAYAETEVSESDTGVLREGAKGTALGAVAGSVAGFLAGLVLFAIPGIGPVVGRGVWLAAAAHGGALAGGLVGGAASIKLSDAWELTFQTKQGRVLVSVHSDDAGAVERAETILRQHAPLSLERYDAAGRRLAAA